MKITAVLLKVGQTRVIISPMSPKIREKREKRECEREREEKRLATVFFHIYTWIYTWIFMFWLSISIKGHAYGFAHATVIVIRTHISKSKSLKFGNKTSPLFLKTIDHFTFVFLVTWPLSGSEAAVDLAMIQTLKLFRCKFSQLAWKKYY